MLQWQQQQQQLQQRRQQRQRQRSRKNWPLACRLRQFLLQHIKQEQQQQ